MKCFNFLGVNTQAKYLTPPIAYCLLDVVSYFSVNPAYTTIFSGKRKDLHTPT
jgi:hypothetical protein